MASRWRLLHKAGIDPTAAERFDRYIGEHASKPRVNRTGCGHDAPEPPLTWRERLIQGAMLGTVVVAGFGWMVWRVWG